MTPLLKQIRILTLVFIIALVISGIMVFPLYSELHWIINLKIFSDDFFLQRWLKQVCAGVKNTQEKYPFLFYGFDWLAYSHLIIAALFIGVYKHPVRNRWIIQWAMFACGGVLPLAFIAGAVRGIPFFHILINCFFGLAGLALLAVMQIKINKLKKYRARTETVVTLRDK